MTTNSQADSGNQPKGWDADKVFQAQIHGGYAGNSGNPLNTTIKAYNQSEGNQDSNTLPGKDKIINGLINLAIPHLLLPPSQFLQAQPKGKYLHQVKPSSLPIQLTILQI